MNNFSKARKKLHEFIGIPVDEDFFFRKDKEKYIIQITEGLEKRKIELDFLLKRAKDKT